MQRFSQILDGFDASRGVSNDAGSCYRRRLRIILTTMLSHQQAASPRGGTFSGEAVSPVGNEEGSAVPVISSEVVTDEKSEPTGLQALIAGVSHVAAAARAELARVPTRVVVFALDSISVNEILDHIDLNAIVGKVDLNAIVGQVDMNAILDKVDLGAVLTKIDMQQVLDGIDLNAVIGQVDLDALVEKTDIGAIIASSTGGIASDAVDLVRRQAVGVDEFVAAIAARIRLSRKAKEPAGPPLLLGGEGA
jgi:hypothetical protein